MQFENFPKVPTVLPEAYHKIYESYGVDNRQGQTRMSSVSKKMEEWLHKQVAEDTLNNKHLTTLEIGAGTLNQLPYEDTEIYDVIEPAEMFYKDSVNKHRIRNFYADIDDVPKDAKYDRITSVATFEHILNLPEVVEKCLLLLKDDGCLRVSIPNEGRFLWKLAYSLTTGLEFRLKYGLDYSVLIRHWHCNTADEIEEVLSAYFSDVRMSLFGVGKNFSLYRFYECRTPRKS